MNRRRFIGSTASAFAIGLTGCTGDGTVDGTESQTETTDQPRTETPKETAMSTQTETATPTETSTKTETATETPTETDTQAKADRSTEAPTETETNTPSNAAETTVETSTGPATITHQFYLAMMSDDLERANSFAHPDSPSDLLPVTEDDIPDQNVEIQRIQTRAVEDDAAAVDVTVNTDSEYTLTVGLRTYRGEWRIWNINGCKLVDCR